MRSLLPQGIVLQLLFVGVQELAFYSLYLVNGMILVRLIKYQVQISNADEQTLKIIDKIDDSDRVIKWFLMIIFLLAVDGVLVIIFKHTFTMIGKLSIYFSGEILSWILMLRLIGELKPVFDKKGQYYPALKMKIMISLLLASMIAKNIPELIYYLNEGPKWLKKFDRWGPIFWFS